MLKDKSLDNLAAGETLAALGLTDAASTRYYYALFQAAIHGLTRRGWTPGRIRSGAVSWDHTMVMHSIQLVRGRRTDAALFRAMRELREQADYSDDSVDPGRIASRVAAVREFAEEVTR